MPKPRDLQADILSLRAQNKTYREIAAELGCSLSTVSYWCGKGDKAQVMERTRRRTSLKRDYVFEYKQSRGCLDCGEKYPYWKLQFDHVQGTKVTNVTTMLNSKAYTLDDVKAEIEKCEVVCANCHADRTFWRLQRSGADSLDVTQFYG